MPARGIHHVDLAVRDVALVEPQFEEEVKDLLLDLEHLSREAEADEQ